MQRREVNRELERRFSPEFRNRIDEVVVFRPLTHDEVRCIAQQQIEKIQAAMARSGRELTVTPEALEQLFRTATAWPSGRGS